MRFATGSEHAALPGPLDAVLQAGGATMVDSDGRSVAAHFGSPATEEAVCLSAVGLADRWDRITLELRGAPSGVDAALEALALRAWSVRVEPALAYARCERAEAPACLDALEEVPDVSPADVSSAFAAIAVVGPRSALLLDDVDLPATAAIVREARDCFEVLVPAGEGPGMWRRLVTAGRAHHAACVGLDALERLAASRRLGHASRYG